MIEGLTVSLFGLLITFTALGLFILVMVVLKRLFPAASPQAVAEIEPAEDSVPVMQVTLEGGRDEEVAAAIAAAVVYFQAQASSTLGSRLQHGRGAWWGADHARSVQANPSKGRN